MKTELVRSRRQFIQRLGAAAAGTTGLGSAFASETGLKADISVVYVGTDFNTIEVIDASSRRIIQRIECVQPSSLVIAPDGKTLYAANRISVVRGLPRGTVEAFSIARDGKLTLKHRQELSLAATNPEHLSLSPDGRSLVVTTESGIYNVLPIDEAGIPQRASGIVKAICQTEGGISVFDRKGRVLSAASGARQLRVLSAVEDGTLVPSNIDLDQRSPRHLAMHPVVDAMYLVHDDAVTCVRYDHDAGTLMNLRQTVEGIALSVRPGALALAPNGEFLAACDKSRGIVTWTVHPSNGRLRNKRHFSRELGRVDAIAISSKTKSLVAMSRERDRISVHDVIADGRLSADSLSWVHVPSPRCMAIV